MSKGNIKIEGRIDAVFAHRFVIMTADGKKVLADLGPKGAEAFALDVGAHIVAEGEMKPSELKVGSIARTGESPVTIPHGKTHDHEKGEPSEARMVVEQAGFTVLGEPRRKPKHFEVLARKGDRLVECHVECDGSIRKEKPAEADDDKWASELKTAA